MRLCPSPTELEVFAAGGQTGASIGAHVARCAACRALVEQIRANQDFMAHAGTALADAFQTEADESEATVRHPLPPPGIVPGFDLLQEIGRGGQGVVYRAQQTDSKRPAAVKMLLTGAFASGHQRRRFEREIEIAARLRHPCIVSVFSSGMTTDDRRYVAMEYVPGVSLDRFVRERLPLNGRAGRARTDRIMRLIRSVAEGVGHAHANGVMHRDLKPSNIVVDAEGAPRVLDFGLARSTDSEHGATMTHEFAGTVAYAAPEQFSSDPGLVNTRTDVYAIGLLLFHALTGTHPYPCDGSIAEASRHIISTPPIPPSRFVPRLHSDVETIVLKALSKDPARRYPSASAMAADIDDYLNGRPISARRDSSVYVLRTLAMKHRVPAAAVALVLVTVVAAAIGFALLSRDLDRSRRSAEAALSDSTLQRARLMGAAGDVGRAESLLWEHAVQSGLRTDDSLCVGGTPETLRAAWSLAELYSRLPRFFRTHLNKNPAGIGVDPVKRALWIVDEKGSRWTRSFDGRLLGRTPELVPLDRETRCQASSDGHFVVVQTREAFTVHDLDQGMTLAGPISWDPEFAIAEVAENGTTLVFRRTNYSGKDRNIGVYVLRIFDVRTCSTVTELDDHAIAISLQSCSEGLRLLIGTRSDDDPRVIIRQAPDWKIVQTLRSPESESVHGYSGFRCPRSTPDGAFLLATFESAVCLFDLADQNRMHPSVGRTRSPILVSAIDEFGKRFVVGARDGTISMFSVPDLALRFMISNDAPPRQMAIRSDPNAIALYDYFGNVSVYEASERPWLERVPVSDVTTQSVSVGPDGSMAWGGDEGRLAIRPARASSGPMTVRAHTGGITSVDFSPGGTEILTAGSDGAVHIWGLDGAHRRTIADGLPEIWSARFSPDGRSIAWGERGGLVRVRKDGASAADLVLDCRAGRVPMIAFSPDGGFLATAAAEGVVRVWDLASGRQIHEFAALNRTSRTVAVSPDARLIAAGYDARTVIVWDAESGSRVCSIDGLPWSPYDLKFEPRGNVLFTVGNGGEIIALDPRAGIELAKLSVHNRAIFSLHISPDGRRLYTSGQDPWIGITDLERLRSYIRGNEEYWMNPPPATIAPGVSTPGAGWRD